MCQDMRDFLIQEQSVVLGPDENWFTVGQNLLPISKGHAATRVGLLSVIKVIWPVD
jgi:hypothetical protein